MRTREENEFLVRVGPGPPVAIDCVATGTRLRWRTTSRRESHEVVRILVFRDKLGRVG